MSAKHGSFCTAVNCMDGRFQEPVIGYLKKRFNVSYVDMITEPGPNRILADRLEITKILSIQARIKISIDQHQSVGIAVIGHEDCAGNPADRTRQEEHIRRAVKFLSQTYSNIPVIGLWAPLSGAIEEIGSH